MIKYHEKKSHAMGPVRLTARGGYIRRCSCGWSTYSPHRPTVMAESRSHRNSVSAYAKLVARGKATFIEDRPANRTHHTLTEQEKADLRDFGNALRAAFRGEGL